MINDMVEKVRALGPLGLPQRFQEWDKELEALEHVGQAEAKEVGAHGG